MTRAARCQLFTPNVESILALHILCDPALLSASTAWQSTPNQSGLYQRSFLPAHVSFSRTGWCHTSRCELSCAYSLWVASDLLPRVYLGKFLLMAMNRSARERALLLMRALRFC